MRVNIAFQCVREIRQTMRDGVRIAAEEFKPQLAAIKKVLNEDIKRLEQKLEAAGAPYTPGRAVEYGGQ